jgi:MoaA/NifB/PqqE/SkfB family radical SAM enzyme
MKYALSKGIVMRREWFGCLLFQTYSGQYWQFNTDAFEILRLLKSPLTVAELFDNLFSNDLAIDTQELQSFLDQYEKEGVISQRNEASETLVFHEDKTNLRTDCLIAPSSVTMYVTDFCPKHCLHCATNSHCGIHRDSELKLADWEKVLHELREAGVLMLIVSGGEALAIPHTLQLLKLADDLQFGLTLLTDFDGIKERQITKLQDLKHLVSIQTSLDGATADTHDFLRGKGSFSKTLRRLQMFKEAGINFTVASAIHRKNIEELDQIAELAHEYGASYIYLNAVAPYGRAKKNMQNLLLDEEGLKIVVQTCLRWASEGKIKGRNPFWEEQLAHLGEHDYNPLIETLRAMSLGIYNFAITSKGDCYLDSKQRAEGMLNLGNIKKTRLLAMWNDPRLDKVRSLYSPENYTLAPQEKVEAVLAST